jgi:hypothetical protein
VIDVLWQVVKTAVQRVMTLRMVAWSPPLVAAIVLWWFVRAWMETPAGKEGHSPSPGCASCLLRPFID